MTAKRKLPKKPVEVEISYNTERSTPIIDELLEEAQRKLANSLTPRVAGGWGRVKIDKYYNLELMRHNLILWLTCDTCGASFACQSEIEDMASASDIRILANDLARTCAHVIFDHRSTDCSDAPKKKTKKLRRKDSGAVKPKPQPKATTESCPECGDSTDEYPPWTNKCPHGY